MFPYRVSAWRLAWTCLGELASENEAKGWVNESLRFHTLASIGNTYVKEDWYKGEMNGKWQRFISSLYLYLACYNASLETYNSVIASLQWALSCIDICDMWAYSSPGVQIAVICEGQLLAFIKHWPLLPTLLSISPILAPISARLCQAFPSISKYWPTPAHCPNICPAFTKHYCRLF